MSVTEEINATEFQSLLALAYLFLSMGYYEKAEIIFMALLELTNNSKNRQWVYKNLAVIALNKKEYEKSLNYLREAIGDGNIKSEDFILYLLKAEALWNSSREQEAQNTLQTYYNLIS